MKVKAVKCVFNTSGCCPSFLLAAIHQLCKMFSKNRTTRVLLTLQVLWTFSGKVFRLKIFTKFAINGLLALRLTVVIRMSDC